MTFIEIAEESGLILGIGRQVLEQVCRDIKTSTALKGKVAVNVSAVELSDPGWLDSALAIITESGIDPRRGQCRLLQENAGTGCPVPDRPGQGGRL